MLNDYLDNTDREKDWIQGFQNLMECENGYHKLTPLFDLLHYLLYTLEKIKQYAKQSIS